MKTTIVAMAVAASLAGTRSAPAQDAAQKEKPTIKASLVDAEKNAARAAATVSVKVTGASLVDPATVQEKPQQGQAHLHYQLGDGPVIATTANKLSFHGLKPGTHRIVVMLAANDHSPLGPQDSVTLTVGPNASERK